MLHFNYLRACFMGLIVLLFTIQSSAQNKGDISRDVPINLAQITSILSEAPMEFSQEAQNKPLTFNLPIPSGGERPFKVVESPIMAADFAALYPSFKTYGLVALDNPAVTGRMTVTPYGLNTLIFLESGTMGIRARDLLNPKVHQVYIGDGDDNPLHITKCQLDENLSPQNKLTQLPNEIAAFSNGTTRRTYKFAIVTTGEFEDANGNTPASASAVVVNSVSAIQAFYDRELSVRFTLLTPFIFSDPATDDFNGGAQTVMAAQSVATRFPTIGSYDIGHVLTTDGSGGVAMLGVVCNSTSYAPFSGTGPQKAAGWSGDFSNTTNGWYSLFAHEVGHMFNMPHTFNGTGGFCTGSINAAHSYEIGSGNSFMSYNNLCDALQNITDGGTADNYFHTNSLERAVNYMNSVSCQTSTSTTNTAPVVNPNPCGGAYSIPLSTPFTLTGSGTDANADVIYYSWEQYDEDGAGSPTQGFIGATAAASSIAPLFRSYPPTTSPSRTFPNMAAVVANTYATSFEPLPSVARTLNFRLTGRDYNTNGGGIHSTDLAVTVAGAAFSVTAPNTAGLSFSTGSSTTVTWNIGGTAGYCTSVNIKLSTDGGFTYPYLLAAGTANDGTQLVTFPSGLVNTTTARIKVEQASNTCVVFFDISNVNFSITSTCNAPSTTISSDVPLTTVVGNASLNLGLTNNLGTLITSPISGSISGTESLTASSKATVLCGTLSCTNFNGITASFDVYEFYANVGGTYTFTTNFTFSEAIAIYSGTFSTSSQCTNLLGISRCYNAPNNITNTNSTITVTLATNQKYSLVISNFFFGPTTGNYQVSFTKPSGGDLYSGVPLPAGYAYTYAALNTGTNNIVAVSTSSNFTSLVAGNYQIYGAAYYTGAAAPNPATPASWVGNSLTSILGGSTCQLISSNAKPVTVTSVLKVDLLNLKAASKDNTVIVAWQTATETKNSHFIVQKSKDGQNFVDIGTVKGHGTTTTPQHYDFVDASPYSGLNYYRLQQFDTDGTLDYSKIVSVATTSDKQQEVKIYPNPTHTLLTVEHSTTTETLEVLNALGQVVKTINVKSESPQTNISTSDLDNGIYFLRIHAATGLDKAVKTVRFVKL